MKDPRLDEARELYKIQHPRLVEYKTNVELSAKMALAERAIPASVTGRVKTLDSVLKKLIRKPKHTFNTLSDTVGVRIITNDTGEACGVVRSRFRCLDEEDKAAALGAERLGYPGIHFEIELLPDDPAGSEFVGSGFRAELQVRTHAQHAWCEVSHRFDYKGDMNDRIPKKLKRKLMLTVGLLEVADMSLSDISKEMNELPAFRTNKLLECLEELYSRLTDRMPDRELSRSTLAVLGTLYAGGPDELQDRVKQTFEKKSAILRQIFERNERLEEPRAAMFFQPEALAVYELLESRRDALIDAWRTILPEEELFLLANEFGYSYHEMTGADGS